MASLAASGRLAARMVCGRRMSRGFHMTAYRAVAQNFTMPALSPTMTEGNIQTWRVKDGDQFAAGDVLLEIETDKAAMDVEAQEDGKVFKILQPDGSKGVPVGARIAVLAETEDDLASLEIPPDEAPKESAAKAPEAPAPAPTPTPTPAAAAASTPAKSSTPRPPQKYPLYPSVEHLLHERGLDPKTVVSQITPTGPNGRILKGDVLAFLGQVPAAYPADIEARFETLAHLDLSNIKIKAKPAKPVEAKKAAKEAAPAATKIAELPPSTVSLPVSLAAVIDVQGKLQSSLGVFMPVSTFVARATEVANDELPRAGPAPKPTASDLFDEIVTGHRASKASAFLSRGHYLPQISALPPSILAEQIKKKATKPASTLDVIDILAGTSKAAKKPVARASSSVVPPASAVSTSTNFFSLTVPAAEEKRAQVFLERLKVVLENEPGRLVL